MIQYRHAFVEIGENNIFFISGWLSFLFFIYYQMFRNTFIYIMYKYTFMFILFKTNILKKIHSIKNTKEKKKL